MYEHYYSLPLNPDALMQKKEHQKCSVKQSVADHLHLIITTAFGEMQSDAAYGNSIWEHDFDNIITRIKQQELMKDSLIAAVKKFEKRLAQVKIDVMVKQEEVDAAADKRFKKRLDVYIKGRLTTTDEEIVFRDSFFVSPLSYN